MTVIIKVILIIISCRGREEKGNLGDIVVRLHVECRLV